MAGPVLLTALVPGEVVEARTYSVWRDQEFISKFYFRMIADVGVGLLTTAQITAAMQIAWQTFLSPLLPTDFTLRQYWAAKIKSVTGVILPPIRYTPVYMDQTIVLGDEDDVGTNVETEWCPTIDAATMNRFGALRNQNWRSSVRFGPVPESGQNSSLLEDPQIVIYNTAFTNFAFGPFIGGSVNTVIPNSCLFSPALGVPLAQLTMDQATQDILEWRASKLVGSQRTRKIRAAGY